VVDDEWVVNDEVSEVSDDDDLVDDEAVEVGKINIAKKIYLNIININFLKYYHTTHEKMNMDFAHNHSDSNMTSIF